MRDLNLSSDSEEEKQIFIKRSKVIIIKKDQDDIVINKPKFNQLELIEEQTDREKEAS